MSDELLTELKQSRPYASLAQEAHISILRTAAAVGHAFEEFLKPHAVTATQYNVLRILRGAGTDGLCRNEIRDRMVAPVPDVTRLLDRLEDMHLVSRSRGVADKRHMNARITKDGLKLLERLDAPVIEFHDRLLGHVGERRLRTMIATLAETRRTLV